MEEGSLFDSDTSLEYEDSSGVQEINIRRYLPPAKSLLEGIQFESYSHQILTQAKLVKMLTNKGTCVDHCYINQLEEAMFDHLKLKNQVQQAINGHHSEFNTLTTLSEKYKDRLPVYCKAGYHNQKYFATEIVTLKPGRKIQKQPPSHIPCHTPNQIVFSSDFESGNLAKAYKVSENSYQLILQNDINTRGNNQWFFFKVSGLSKNVPIKLQIMNLIKKESLFNQGMKPTIFSKVRFQKKGIGWVREGQKVHYFQNNLKRQSTPNSSYYSLSFEYKPMYDDDEVYVSHSFPYTYSDLNEYMASILSQIYPHLSLSLDCMGNTLGGNRVDLLTITSKSYSKNKKVVWIMARQHPGEITGSFVVEGVINALLRNDQLGNYLRENTIFRIVPMMNPDGVIYGNSRCELTGIDSNRRWKSPSPSLNPIIHQLKHMISKNMNYPVDMVLDLHSHSKKFGSFFYGNNGVQKQKSRVFPLIVSNHDLRFDFKSSRFTSSSKLTARYSLFSLLKTSHVFSVESSFYGYQKNNKLLEYFPKDYRELGESLLEGYARIINLENPCLLRPQLTVESALQILQQERQLIQDGEKQSIGSDSDAGGDEFQESEMNKILPKKMEILKKRRKTLKEIGQVKEIKQQRIHLQRQPPKVLSKLEVRDQRKSSSTLFKKRNSLMPMNKKAAIEEKHRASVKREIYSFAPQQQQDASKMKLGTNKLGNINSRMYSTDKKLKTKASEVENNDTSIMHKTKANRSINLRLFSELKENSACKKHCYRS